MYSCTKDKHGQVVLYEELLQHMSPLGWEHINLLGEYHFNSEKVISLDSLRPLKLS
ncbi:Tn3 family transposase [Bacillus sp. FJAT-29790]|uniref:Tn3 family transposase n=1 Tax=Bacillus sp. FJAT-29790 TaxID=1895002 RepID=UPI00349FB10A